MMTFPSNPIEIRQVNYEDGSSELEYRYILESGTWSEWFTVKSISWEKAYG